MRGIATMLLPFIVGLAVVGVVWAGHKGPKQGGDGGDLKRFKETASAAPTSSTSDVPADGTYEDPNVEMDANPNGQNTSAVATTTTTETGAETTTTDQPSSPSSTTTAPPQVPQIVAAGPDTADATAQPAPTGFVLSGFSAGFSTKYGSTTTKADTSEYYSSQLGNGTVVL